MQAITDVQFKSFDDFINNHDSFIVVGHKEPDGDCISSCLGLASLIQKKGKTVQTVSAGPFKRAELRRFESLFPKKWQKTATPVNRTGLFIVDCSEKQRLGDISCDTFDQSIDSFDVFIIDHHKTSDGSMPNCIIDPKAPAAACLVQQLYENSLGDMDSDTAKILFFGICTDTGFFRFLDNESSDIFNAASRLVARGANPRITYDDMTSGKPFQTRKLLGLMLSRAETKCGGKLIVTWETQEDTRRYGSEGRDSDSLYQLLLAVDGVEAVLFIRQETDKSCTAGFRSRNDVDVSSIAAKFGGGGHKNAAGMSTEGTIDKLLPRILTEFGKVFKKIERNH